MIVKAHNSVKFKKVIQASELESTIILIRQAELIEQEAQAKLAKAQIEATSILDNARNEAVVIKQQAYDEIVNQITQENKQALADFKSNIDDFLTELSNNLYPIIYRISNKLGLNLTTQAIANLIQQELEFFSNCDKLKVFANSKIIASLQQELSITTHEIEWLVNDELNNLECILSTKLWTLHLDIAGFKEQLHELLQKNK